MTFARKLTLAMALLLSLTLSAGGAWTIGRNFSAALDTAAADAAARHLRERYAVEELLAGTGGQPGDIARAVFGYARSLRAAGGSGYCFAVLDGSGTVLWSDLPRAVSFASQWQAVQAGAGAMLYCGSADDAWLVLASPLQGQDTALYLVGGYDVTAQFAEHGRQLRQYLAVECAALALAVGAAALLAWGLTRPLRRLEAASRDLAAGDYARRVPPGGGARKYRTCDTIQRYIDHVERKAQEIGEGGRLAELNLKKLEAEVALKESQGSLHRLKTAIAEGKYLPAEQATEELAEFMTAFQKFAMTIPARMAGAMSGYADAITIRNAQKAIRKELETMLTAYVDAMQVEDTPGAEP